eukprot:262725-Pleurochrysis_carterae.AAC.1
MAYGQTNGKAYGTQGFLDDEFRDIGKRIIPASVREGCDDVDGVRSGLRVRGGCRGSAGNCHGAYPCALDGSIEGSHDAN